MKNLSHDHDESPVPVVIYGARSTEDVADSVTTQIEDCRELAERESWEIVSEFTDEGFSAYTGNRGAGLERAKRLTADLAANRGQCILAAQYSDRLARGAGDAPGAAAHLMELHFWASRRGIVLWTAQSGKLDRMRAFMEGERNTEDSRRKSEAVKSGKRRAYERGELGGGPVLDGYRALREVDDRGRVTRTFALDPDRAPIIRRAFELAAEGLGDPTIARELNAASHRTRAGQPWTRRRVQDTLTNASYAGAVVWHRGQVDQELNWDGQHPALIDRQTFDRLRREREGRDKAAGSDRNPAGRPFRNHALARLAECGRCEAIMRPITSSYRRKDGTKRRDYICINVYENTGLCDAPRIDAELVDRVVIDRLDRYLGDVDTWRERFIEGHKAERAALETNAEEARADLADLDHRLAALERKAEQYLADGKDDLAEEALALLTKRRPDRKQIERRVKAHEDAIASVPDEAPVDAMLDFYNALTQAVQGRLDHAGRDSMAKVNEALRDLFERFILATVEGGIIIAPVLLSGAVDTSRAIMAPYDQPPLRKLTAPPPAALDPPSTQPANSQG